MEQDIKRSQIGMGEDWWWPWLIQVGNHVSNILPVWVVFSAFDLRQL